MIPVCFDASGSVRAPTQYQSAKWADVVHVFWPLSRQPSPSLRRLELHRRGVGAGVGLAVADREVDVVTEDLRQELLLHLVGAVTQDRLADDADALADLRAATGCERLVEEVLVDAVAFLTAPLGRPGDAEPTLLRHLAHERAAIGSVGDLRHVLARHVEEHRVVVGVEELLDFVAERELLGRKLEIHAAVSLPTDPQSRPGEVAPRRSRAETPGEVVAAGSDLVPACRRVDEWGIGGEHATDLVDRYHLRLELGELGSPEVPEVHQAE